ncbi:glycosyltransferase [Bacteroidota bacterium]
MNQPVLLLIYNRPAHTKKVLSQVLKCGITEIYVSADGPKNRADEALCRETKNIIAQSGINVVASQYSKTNLGCNTAVVNGISWFFKQVESGIILEDDCFPSDCFFSVCSELLEKYRKNPQVMMVSGNNPLGRWNTGKSHHFSRIGHVWGWGTWRDRWPTFNPELPNFNDFVNLNGFEKLFGPTRLAKNRKRLTEKSLAGGIDTWDYQWNCSMNMHDGLAAISSVNLVQNLGLNNTGTNTFSGGNWINNQIENVTLNIEDVAFIPDAEYEMELSLCQRANQPANACSPHFWEKGLSLKNKRLRILQINSTDLGGGAEKIALNHHEKLLEFGYQSTLLVEAKKSDSATIFEIKSDFESQIKDLKPDVIHVHNLHGTSLELATIARLSHTYPTLFTLHDSWLTTGSVKHPFEIDPERLNFIDRKNWNTTFQERKQLIEQSNIRFLAPSQWIKERFFNQHYRRPFYAPYGIETVDMEDVAFPSERFILFVGNNPESNPYKDYSTLKKAWEIANNQLGNDALDLIVLGGKTFTKTVGGKTIFGVSKQPKSKVSAYMKKAVLVAQISKQDNAPLTIFEAHQQGTPVLGSLVGGIPEQFTISERKLLSQPADVKGLSESIIEAAAKSASLRNEVISFWEDSCNTYDTAYMTNVYLGHYDDMSHG